MITTENYFKQVKSVDFSALPETLKKSHDLVVRVSQNGSSWALYDSNENIKRVIDLYFTKLSENLDSTDVFKQAKPAPPKKEKVFTAKSRGKKGIKTNPEISATTIDKAKKAVKKVSDSKKTVAKYKAGQSLITSGGKEIEVDSYMWMTDKKVWVYYGSKADYKNDVYYLESELKPAPAKKAEPKKASKTVESFDIGVVLIRRVKGIIGKNKTYDEIRNVYVAIKKAITEKKVSKKSLYGELVFNLEQRIGTLLEAMKDQKITTVNVKIDQEILDQILAIAGDITIYPAIPLIKRYVLIEGSNPGKDKAGKLDKAVKQALKKVTKKNKYYNELITIKDSLSQYMLDKADYLRIEPAKLNGLRGIAGLSGLGCDEGCDEVVHSGLKGGMSARDLAKRDMSVMDFRGVWATLVGQPSKNFDMMLHGQPGGGKTTFLLRFAEYLADHFGRVAYVSSEEYAATTLTRKVNEMFNPIPENLVFAEGIEPDAKLTGFDFLILDSVNDLGLDLEGYKVLRENNPNMGFIIVLQTTKDGKFKGGKEWEHEVEIAGEVTSGEIKIYKNRYGVKGDLKFFQQ